MRNAHTRANEQATQADHPMQVAATLRIIPANPLIADRQAQRRRSEADGTQPTVLRLQEITYLAANPGAGASRMLMRHQRIPDRPLRCIFNQHQLQAAHLTEFVGHRDCRRNAFTRSARSVCPWRRARRRQHDVLCTLKFTRRLQAATALGLPARIHEAKRCAHVHLQRSAMHRTRLVQNRLQPNQTRRAAHAVCLPRQRSARGRRLFSAICGYRAGLAGR